MKKKFYAILLTALMLFSVGCGAALANDTHASWITPFDGNGTDVGLHYYTSSDVIYGKTKVESSDWERHRIIELSSALSTDAITLTASPTAIGGLTFRWSQDVSPDSKVVYGWLDGTAEDVKKDDTFQINITAHRTSNGTTTDLNLSPNPAELTFTIAVNPEIAPATPETIVWGQSWKGFIPTLANGKVVNSADWSVIPSGDIYLSRDALQSDDFKFNEKTGELSLRDTWKPAYCSNDITSPDWDLKDFTKKIKLNIQRGSGDRAVSDDEVFTLTFRAVAPTIMSDDTEISKALKAANFKWSKDISPDNAVVVTAEGPGLISWDVNGCLVGPSTSADVSSDRNVISDDALGLVYSVKQEGYTSTLKIYGKPTTTIGGEDNFLITAKNAKGSTSVLADLYIGSDSFDVNVVSTSADLPSRDVKVGDSIGTVILEAQPGPVAWSYEKLPAGLTLTPLQDGKRAILTGTFTTRTGEDGITYKITATNTVLASSDVKSADITVWDKPVVSNAYAFTDKNTITTKTAYNWELKGTNFPYYASWDVEIDGLKVNGWGTSKTWNVKDGTSYISFDVVSKDGKATAKLVGSIDRVPEDGVFTVKVRAENFYGKSDPAEFTVNVAGVAPSMTAQSFVLDTATTGKANVDKGDAPLKMTATITDSKTLAAFGLSDPITLTDRANVYTGLSFVYSDDGQAVFKYAKPSKGAVAYTKLPVTVTAVNTADSTLVAKPVKHLITVTGKSPAFVNSNDISKTYCDILPKSTDVPAAVTLTVPAGDALPATDAKGRIVFKIEGANPLVTTIKPASANGIEVATEENGKLLTFTGTPKESKKDVTSKFTVTTTNPLTNESKKIVVTVIAKPKPVIDTSKTLDKEVLVGKKVKITPKATVTTTGMKWAISKVSGGSSNGGGTVDTLAKLTAQYGLEFDTTKGTISGTATHPTGKDDPIVVEFRATDSTGTVSSDTATAKITILGAKPKLLTKKMTLEVNTPLTTTAGGTGVLETNLDDANTGESSGLHIANVQIEATTPLPDGISVLDNTNNAPTLSGTPSKAMKKVATEFQLKNFDTVGKGKITFMVANQTPTLDATTTKTVNVGETETVNLKVNNASNPDLKYKWKITTKPSVSGVSAKIKGNGMYATVTIKVNKKVKDTSDTLTVTVTDPLTKATNTSGGVINITIPQTTTTSDSPLEAGETKAETKAEAKDIAAVEKEVGDVALGEGEVHMGAGRTADKLTAAQRKAIEDKGYVIAAVLPEIEVTASGQYDFEVDLDKEVKTGAELVWFAFSTKPTTDDEIVDFADEKGEETKVVPESHVVIVAPWLNAEAKYAPVIAVKADAKDADATTAEGVKEAAEAKTEE
ncbi:MAG: hypothetical protein SPL10_06550 [Synergistales bacterium]|nr:hypothetical protein [Synergistales bacterium]MDY6401878.1 hypothetical protein [Synergistales bacterium]MDY6403892.1 hypothetical protein [Synergistales bacterium]MDY6409886.1 hypothetical protein [Synergistales bacterium]MDY6414800.1 hypothetical protein [Synergistales bacterium]